MTLQDEIVALEAWTISADDKLESLGRPLPIIKLMKWIDSEGSRINESMITKAFASLEKGYALRNTFERLKHMIEDNPDIQRAIHEHSIHQGSSYLRTLAWLDYGIGHLRCNIIGFHLSIESIRAEALEVVDLLSGKPELKNVNLTPAQKQRKKQLYNAARRITASMLTSISQRKKDITYLQKTDEKERKGDFFYLERIIQTIKQQLKADSKK